MGAKHSIDQAQLKPEGYRRFLLGHEGPQGISSHLKAQGLAAVYPLSAIA